MIPENRIIAIHLDSADWVDVHATIVRDHIAVHPSFPLGGALMVTHIPTGKALCLAHRKPVAVAAAAAFDRLPVDWSSTNLETAKNWPAELRKQAETLKELAWLGDIKALKAAHS